MAGVGPPDPRTKVWVGPIMWRYWYSRSGGAIQGQVEEGLDPPTILLLPFNNPRGCGSCAVLRGEDENTFLGHKGIIFFLQN